jgi:class 3 adenylate cyclase
LFTTLLPSNSLFTRLLNKYASQGLDKMSASDRSRRFALNSNCLTAGTTALGYAAFFAIYDFQGLVVAWAAMLLASSVLFLPNLAQRNISLAVLIAALTILILFVWLTYHLSAASGLYLFIILLPLNLVIANGLTRRLGTTLWTGASIAAMAFCIIAFDEPSGYARTDPQLLRYLNLSVLALIISMITGGLFILAGRVALAEAALEAEHAKSEALLDNLLPADIAARLKGAPNQIIADDIPEVTILFADIANFTPRATSMQPEALIRFLNRVFTAFDHLTHERGLEKIKTIGDAYMVAAGMPVARADHADIIADMALAMLEVTKELSQQMDQPVEVRIGLHSGSAIAGVIGKQKIFYDVWGDTVNTASRMESQGEVGRIQLTDETRAALGDRFVFEKRGLVDIKGKGPAETFWLIAKAGPDFAKSTQKSGRQTALADE